MISIKGYEGLYSVSECGYVQSDARWVGNTKLRWLTAREKVSRVSSEGYRQVSLNHEGQSSHFQIHRLVAIAFIPNPEKKPEVNHKDFNKLNNCKGNLEWATGLENKRHAAESRKRLGITYVPHK